MSTTTSEFTVGHYRVGKCIGQGTFGKVRLGIHIPTEQKVAVKTLQKQKIVEQADIERVTREICILKILRHPNIIQLYEIIETKTDIHLIMEYAEGGELFDYIVKRKRLDETESVNFTQQILSGVQYIHKNGIVHRDLKPQNLLLDHNKLIKIVDFGLSNQYKPGEKLKTACGSPCYAAPEMIAGKRYECLNVDVWSCGIILYAMLCGYLPFQDQNTNKLYKKIMTGDFELPKILTADSKDILKNILNVNPETRYKIEQIRQSKWYKLVSKNYNTVGIIVGKDPIQTNQKILLRLQKQGIDQTQVKNYIANNRHNHITAHYYLLKIKMEKQDQIEKEKEKLTLSIPSKSTAPEKRNESPLIYRPQPKKQYFIPPKKTVIKESKDTSRNNDSFNVSTIIFSLVQAKKNKLVSGNSLANKTTKNQDNFDKLQEFKIFPKKKTSSIYQQNTSINKSSLTSRSETDQKPFQYRPNRASMTPNQQINITSSEKEETKETATFEGQEVINKKRQQLSDQLKQISIKINKQLLELRKQNNTASTSIDSNSSINKRIDSMISNTQDPPQPQAQEPKTQTNNIQNNNYFTSNVAASNISASNSTVQNKIESVIISIQPLNISKNISNLSSNTTRQRLNQFRQSTAIRYPKTHYGPFNVQCLFNDNPKNIINRINECLNQKLHMKVQQIDQFTLQVSEYQQIFVQSIQGINGYYLVKFSTNNPLNESIIEYLSK